MMRRTRSLALATALLLAAIAESADAQVVRAFAPRYSRTDRGNFVSIGNTLMTCPDSASSCANARAGIGSVNNNQDFPMVAVDVDAADPGANSSTATLTLPAGSTVRFAALYWGATSSSAARNQARLRTPSSSTYNSLTASQLDVSGTAYHAFADVTALVAAGGSGSYTVADVKATTGVNAYAGWSLVVVFSDATESPHNVTLFDGFANVTSGGGGATMTISGFVTPPSGFVHTTLAAVAYEGDLGNPGDGLRLNGTALSNPLNAANNVFNSTISSLGVHVTAKAPNYVNQLGYDSDILDASGRLANSATSATVQFAPGSDGYLPGALVFSTAIFQPLIAPNFVKTVSDVNGGFIAPGDILEYTLSASNTGNDAADEVVLTDAIPANTTYVAGSLSVVSGANAGAKTDAAGDDQAEFDASNNRVVFRLGTGATAAAGGALAATESTVIRFRVTIGAATANGTTISNSAGITYTERQLGGAVAIESTTALSRLNVPDLTITKSHSGNFMRGATGTYSVLVTNSGLSATSGPVTVTDELPAGLTPTTASGSGWACSIVGQNVSCTRSNSLAAGAAFPAISIAVMVSQGAASSVTNTAIVDGGGQIPSSNDSDDDVTTVVSRADLAIVKSGPASAMANSNVVYTVTVTNNGPSDAGDIVVTDPTPLGLTFVSNTGACTTAYPCMLGTVETGGTRTITTTYFVPSTYTAPTTIVNSASVTSSTTDPASSNNSSSASTPVTPSTDLVITKSGPASVTAGNNIVYTVLVSNGGSLGATSVSVSDPTPTGLTFVSNGGDCTTAYPCTLGSMAAGSTRTITSTYLVAPSYSGPNPLLNTATVSSATADWAPGNNSSTASTTVTASANLAITKTGPPSATAGTNAIFSVVVVNNGSSDAAAVTVADPTPAGLTFVSNSGHCTTAYPCSLGVVPAGATRTITTTYAMPASYSGANPILNTASVSSSTNDPAPADNSSTSSTPVVTSANLAITKLGPASASAGENIVYSVTVTNNGSSNAAAVSVADPTPSGLVFVSNSGHCTTAYPCALGSIPAGESRAITTTFEIPSSYTAPDPIVNTATVSSSTSDPDPADNTSTSSTPVVVSADLSIVKTGAASVLAGEDIVYTVVVTNNGSADAANVSVTDPTPAGLVFVSNTGDCTSAWPCPLGTLPDGASRTITSTYHVPASYSAATIGNTATVSSITADAVAANNSSTVSTTVSASADLSIGKSGPASVVAGTNAVFTVTVTNDGVSDAASVMVDDPTPAGLAFVSNAGDCVSAYPCTLGNVAAGAWRTITTTYSVPPSYAGPSPFLNIATVSSPTTDPVPANNSSMSSTSVTTSADVAIEKIAPAAVIAGTDLVYTVAVTNHGTSDALAVTVSDPTPPGLTFVSNTGACTTAYPCSLGTVAAGATATITSTYAVPPAYTTPDPILNTATVASSTSDPDTGNNSSSTSTELTIIDADLDIDLAGPASAVPGTSLVYTATITNHGPDDAIAITVNNATPPGLVFVSNTGDCTTTYPCSLGTLGVGATRTITSMFSVPASYTTPDPIVNTVLVASSAGDSTPANNSATVSSEVLPSAGLSIAKDGPASVVPGTDMVYTVTVTNDGSSDARSVTVEDPTPTGLTFVSNIGACSTPYPCTLGTIAAGTSRTITTTYSVPSSYTTPDPILNTATVSSTTSDPEPADNTSTWSTAIAAVANLTITKSDETDPVEPGATQVYTIMVSNAGPSDATGVVVTDTLDPNTTYISNTGGCSAMSGTLTCPLAPIASGAARSFTISVLVSEDAPVDGTLQAGPCDGSEDLCNTASVTADQADANPSNNTTSEPTDVELFSIEGLSLAVTDAPDPVLAGTTLTYVLTYSNAGASLIQDAELVVTWDSRTTFVSAAPAPNVSDNEWNLGTLAPGAVGEIVVQVTVDGSAADGETLLASAELGGRRAIAALADEETLVRNAASNRAALAVSKTVSPASVYSGGLLTYTIDVRNDGPATSYSTILSDPLPPGLTYLNASPAPDAAIGNALEWGIGDLASGQAASFVVYAETDNSLPAGTLIENNAYAAGTPGLGTVASAGLNAEGSDTASLSGPGGDCNMVVRLRSLGIALPGGEFVYRLLWEMPCDDAPSATATHDLPAEVSFVSLSSTDVLSYSVEPAGGHERVVLDVGTISRGRVGAAFVRVRLAESVAIGTIFASDLGLVDAAGRSLDARDESTVRDPAAVAITRSYLRVTGRLRVIEGTRPIYVVRYRDVPPDSSMTISVTGSFVPQSLRPTPSGVVPPPPGTTAAWKWSGVEGRGVIKLRGLAVFDGPVEASGVISIDAELSAPDGTGIVKSGRDVGVLGSLGGSASRGRAVLKTQRFARGGKTATARLRYRELTGQPTVAMNLPSFLVTSSYSPEPAASVADNAFFWNALPLGKAVMKVKTAVPADLIPQASLAVGATVTDDFGTIAVERAKGAP